MLVLPLYVMLSKSFENKAGEFVGLANYALYFASPALSQSIWNSFWVSAVSAVITILLAFVYAYGLTRTAIPFKGLFRGIAFLPILAPSLLPGISLVYLFGNQGMLKGMLLGGSIYGPWGIVAGEVFYCFPHAFLIISTALSLADFATLRGGDFAGARAGRKSSGR